MFCPPHPTPLPQWPLGDPGTDSLLPAEAFSPVMLTPCGKAERSVGCVGGGLRYGGLTASETVLILPQQVGQ